MNLRPVSAPATALRIAFFAALVVWAIVAGKDVSWDFINHQLYLPYAWLGGRIHTDLFGAGPQSYQNPLGYFPIYALVKAGLPAWVIGVLLGAVHALVVWPIDRIGRLFWPSNTARDLGFRLLSLGLCCVAPILLIHVGTTSTDPIANVMVVWSIALTLEAGHASAAKAGSPRSAAIAGALLGLSSAIKLSNATLALALCALWGVKWLVGQVQARRVAAFGAGLAGAFLLAAGPWMWMLWRDFGNPIFPLFNNVFHSPFAPQQAITALRFLPNTPWNVVSRLWEMTQFSNFVTFEAFLPDIRPLMAAVAAFAALFVLRGRWRGMVSRAGWHEPGVQLALFALLAYFLWMRSSGNARYALPLFVVIGVGLVRATQRALPPRAATMVLVALLAVQCGDSFVLASRRLSGTTWDAGPYINYQVPARLRTQPFLHLAFGTQTNASIAPFLAPDGALANPIGQLSIPTDGPLGARLRALMDRWHGRTRVLFNAPDAISANDIEHVHENTRAWLYRLGIDVDWSDCESIKLMAAEHEDRVWATDSGKRPDRERDLRSCGVLYRVDKDATADAQRVVADRVFAVLETACPQDFSPTPLTSEHTLAGWSRHYMNTEAELGVSAIGGVNFSHFRMFYGTHFGSIDDVLSQKTPIQCPEIINHPAL